MGHLSCMLPFNGVIERQIVLTDIYRMFSQYQLGEFDKRSHDSQQFFIVTKVPCERCKSSLPTWQKFPTMLQKCPIVTKVPHST